MKKIIYIALCALFALAFTTQTSLANPYAVCRTSSNPKRCYYRIKHRLANHDRRQENKTVRKIVRHERKKITRHEVKRIERRADQVHRRNQQRRRIQAGTAKTVKVINGVKYVQYYDRNGRLRMKVK